MRLSLEDHPDAFECLVLRYQKQVYAIARSLRVEGGAIDDVVQETFLRAFKELKSLREPASFGTWLLNIARNLAHTHLSVRDRPPRAASRPPEATPAESLEQKDFAEYLWGKVSALPEGIRETIFLYYHDGRSTGKVAKALGVSRSVVKNRLKQGRVLLRDRLWREMEDSFRDMLPSVRGWKRRGRYLALLAILSVPPASTLRSETFTTLSGGAGAAGSLALGTVIIAVSLLGGAAVYRSLWRPDAPVSSAGRMAASAEPAGPSGAGQTGRPGLETAVVTAAPADLLEGVVYLGNRETPAAGATVVLLLPGETRPAALATTGANGNFRFDRLPAHLCRVWAWKGSWTTCAADREPIEVPAAASRAPLERILVPGVIVSGVVMASGSGKGIAGATVEYAPYRSSETGREGRFVLEGMPSGQVRLSAYAPAHAARSLQLDLGAGEEPQLRIELDPGGTVEGRVLTPEGDPAPGAQVIARAGAARLEGRSDAGGRYRLPGIPFGPGRIRLSASRDGLFAAAAEIEGFPDGEARLHLDLRLESGFALAGRAVDSERIPLGDVEVHLDWDSQGAVAKSDGEGRFRIEGVSDRCEVLTGRKRGYAPASLRLAELPAAKRECLELVLGPGHHLAGAVVDGEGRGIPGAWVYVDTGDSVAGPYPRTYTAPDGGFRFEDLPGSFEEIGAAKIGFLDSRGNRPPLDTEDVTLVLEKEGRIQGVVFDAETGEPIPSFRVRVSPGKNSEETRRKILRSAGLTAEPLSFGSPAGGFTVRQLVAGAAYRLEFAADDHLEAVLEDLVSRCSEKEPEPIRVELLRGGTLAGQVISQADRRPLDRVVVTYRSREPEVHRTALSDREGKFSITGLPPEPGVLLLERTGHGKTSFRGVAPGEQLQVFEIPEEAVVAGRVTGAAGEPVRGAELKVRVGEGTFPAASSDAEGRYRVPGLPGGAARVTVSVAGMVPRSQETALLPGQVTVVDFRLAEGSIAGTVSQGGVPVPGAQVRLEVPGATRIESATADGAGRFLFSGLPAGSYLVTARRPQDPNTAASVARSTVLVGTGQASLDLVFPAARIAGRVVDGDTGTAAAGWLVALSSDSHDRLGNGRFRLRGPWEPFRSAKLPPGESGFAFDTLPPGRYYLVASPAAGKGAGGWLGPLEVGEGTELLDLMIAVAGAEGAEVEVLSARLGTPVAQAGLKVLLETGFPVDVSPTDASGKSRLPVPVAGATVEVRANGYLPATARLETAGPILLEPVSKLVLVCRGPAGEGPVVLVTLLSGNDPGWPYRSVDGKEPMAVAARKAAGPPAEFQIDIAPGRSRLRFEFHRGPVREPPFVAREFEVDAPPAGEVRVEMEMP